MRTDSHVQDLIHMEAERGGGGGAKVGKGEVEEMGREMKEGKSGKGGDCVWCFI